MMEYIVCTILAIVGGLVILGVSTSYFEYKKIKEVSSILDKDAREKVIELIKDKKEK